MDKDYLEYFEGPKKQQITLFYKITNSKKYHW